jgi:hypothetical protein
MRSTGALKTFQEVTGTFDSMPISFSEAIVTTNYSIRRGNLEMSSTLTAIVDIYSGSYRLTGGQIAVADKTSGEALTSLTVEADGSFDPANFDSLVIKVNGMF